MIWVGIIGSILVGPCKVLDGIKMSAHAYIAFLRENLEHWLKKAKDHLQENHHIYAR